MEQPSVVKRFLFNIWPVMYRIINGTVYFILRLIKGIAHMAMQQIKQ